MSKKTLSPSIGITRGQAGKLLEMTEHGLLKSPVFSGVPTFKIDKFVKSVGPGGLRDAFVALAEDRFEDFFGVRRILVNYDVPNAIVVAIEKNGFDKNIFMGIPVEEIPIIGRGQATHRVHEVHFGKIRYNRDLPEALKIRGMELGFKDGFKFADPLTSLLYALKLPDRQKQYPLGILFYNTAGELCCLYLNAYGGSRSLGVSRDGPGSDWSDCVRFLAVPAEFQASVA